MKKMLFVIVLLVLIFTLNSTVSNLNYADIDGAFIFGYSPVFNGFSVKLAFRNVTLSRRIQGFYMRIYSDSKGSPKGKNLEDDQPYIWFEKIDKNIYSTFALGFAPLCMVDKTTKRFRLAPFIGFWRKDYVQQYYSPETGWYWYKEDRSKLRLDAGIEAMALIRKHIVVGVEYSINSEYGLSVGVEF